MIMIDKLKNNKNMKGIAAFLGFVLLLAVGSLFLDSGQTTSAPKTYDTLHNRQKDPPKLESKLKKKELPSLNTLEKKSKSSIDISKYKETIVSSITYNTMGNYELPEELHKKLSLEIDTVVMSTLQRVEDYYKKYKINILASDTSGAIVFQKKE